MGKFEFEIVWTRREDTWEKSVNVPDKDGHMVMADNRSEIIRNI
jgi:hypothetical protein